MLARPVAYRWCRGPDSLAEMNGTHQKASRLVNRGPQQWNSVSLVVNFLINDMTMKVLYKILSESKQTGQNVACCEEHRNVIIWVRSLTPETRPSSQQHHLLSFKYSRSLKSNVSIAEHAVFPWWGREKITINPWAPCQPRLHIVSSFLGQPRLQSEMQQQQQQTDN